MVVIVFVVAVVFVGRPRPLQHGWSCDFDANLRPCSTKFNLHFAHSELVVHEYPAAIEISAVVMVVTTLT